MDETIKQNIMKVVVVVIMFILLLCTITANSKYSKLQNEVDSYKYEISDLEKKNQDYETLIESYKQSQLEDKETITTQLETITELENKIDTKDSQIKQLTTRITELETQSNKLLEDITTLQKNIKEQGNTITLLNASINDLNTQLVTAHTKVNTLTTTNTNLSKEVKELQEKLSTLNTYYVVNSEVELLAALKKDGNIILNSDILMSSEAVVKDKHISLDLNGHNLVVTTIQLNNTNLKIKDSSTNQTGKMSVFDSNTTLTSGIKIGKESVLEVTNGNFEGNGVIQNIEGTLYIIGGTFNSNNPEFETDTIKVLENASAYVYGGVFKDKGGITNSGYLFIDGGEYYGNHIVYSLNGTTKINNYSYKGTTINGHIAWVDGKLDLSESSIGDDTFLIIPVVDNLSTDKITIGDEYKMEDDNGLLPTVSVRNEYIIITK